MSGSAQQLDQVRDAPTAPDQRRGDRPRGRLIDRHTALAGAKAPTERMAASLMRSDWETYGVSEIY
jgi:hypothetical protein